MNPCLVTLPAFITFLVLFVWTATSGIFGEDDDGNQNQNQNQNNGNYNNNYNENGEYRPWYDYDMRREEIEGVKILLTLGVLLIACGTLYTPISKAGSGFCDRFNEGVLAASMFMFGNMLFVSFWYNVNLGEQEQGGGGGGYNPYWYWQLDERERLFYHEKVVAYTSLAFGLAFYVASVFIGFGAMTIPEDGNAGNVAHNNSFHPHIAEQFKVLSAMWTLISICTFVVFLVLFIAACVLAAGEGGGEEDNSTNVAVVLLWMFLVTVTLMVSGFEVFLLQKTGTLGMGTLYGGTKYFAGLLFVTCLFLSAVFALFSSKAREYQVAAIDASSAVTVLEPKTGIVDKNTGDFVRVDENGTQMV